MKAFGMAVEVGEYSQVCTVDGEGAEGFTKNGAVLDKSTNVYTFPADKGAMELMWGSIGAARLAAMSTGVFAMTLSVY